jgi:hypothetical protein
MINISSADAFLIFGKWRDNKSQLQVSFLESGKQVGGTPAVIIESSPKEETISVSIVAIEQPAQWDVSLRGASFQYGEPSDSPPFPERAEGVWESYLCVEMLDGKMAFFAERFLGDEEVDKDVLRP